MTSEEFDRFYRAHWGPTVTYASCLGCGYQDAEDLAHDVFVDVWLHGQRCALQTMVFQRVLRLKRRRRRETELGLREQQVFDSTQEVVVTDWIDAVVGELRRQILTRKYEGFTDAEIGRELQMTRAGIGKHVKVLRKRFSG